MLSLQPLLQPLTTLLHPLFILFFSLVIIYKWFSTSNNSSRNLPPSPPRLPIIGNLHQLGLYPHKSLCFLARKYGPLMLLQLGSSPTLIVSSADAAQEVMKTHDLIFSDRPESKIGRRLLYDGKTVSLAPYGEYWRQVRGICVLQLLSNRKVKSFQNVREEEMMLMIEKIEQSPSLINLSEMFATLTNDVVCRVALGRKYGGEKDGKKFKEMLSEFTELLGNFNFGGWIPGLGWLNYLSGLDAKVEKVAKEFDEFLDGLIEEHMLQKKPESHGNQFQGEEKNFIEVLIKVQEEDMAGLPIDRDSIKAVILDMFAGGTDTTYTVLEWAMTELLRHQEIMKKLQTEVRGLAATKQYVTEDDLEHLKYLRAIIKETLRLHPPIPLLVARRSIQDVKLKGYDIAAGTMVITNSWSIGRDPTSWEKPEEFRPERFLNSSVTFTGHDFQLIPFGAGRRGCPGIAFAMTINELVLANLVHKFDWKLPGGLEAEDLDMTECTGVTIHRKSPLLAIATPFSG